MKVTSVEYKNYRNLEDGFLVPCDGVNVIYGDNAQGKTNLIEALWLFCGGHSFRTSKDSEVIKWNSDFARLDLNFFGQERNQKASIIIGSKRKLVSINGVEKKITDYVVTYEDRLNCFTHLAEQTGKYSIPLINWDCGGVWGMASIDRKKASRILKIRSAYGIHSLCTTALCL